jgi:hypothetical protein
MNTSIPRRSPEGLFLWQEHLATTLHLCVCTPIPTKVHTRYVTRPLCKAQKSVTQTRIQRNTSISATFPGRVPPCILWRRPREEAQEGFFDGRQTLQPRYIYAYALASPQRSTRSVQTNTHAKERFSATMFTAGKEYAELFELSLPAIFVCARIPNLHMRSHLHSHASNSCLFLQSSYALASPISICARIFTRTLPTVKL